MAISELVLAKGIFHSEGHSTLFLFHTFDANLMTLNAKDVTPSDSEDITKGIENTSLSCGVRGGTKHLDR